MTLMEPRFPVVGLLTDAPFEPGENGTREFPSADDFTRCRPAEVRLRRGMLLFDVEGRSWEVAGVDVLGPANRWLGRQWEKLGPGAPFVRVKYDLVERPSATFDEVRGQLKAQLQRYRAGYAVFGNQYFWMDLARIKAANDLTDLIKTEQQWAIERAPGEAPSRFEQLLGEGRLGRLGFILFMAAAAAACAAMNRLSVLHPAWTVGAIILFAALTISGLSRRLKDLGLSPHLQWAFFVWTMPFAALHDAFHGDKFRFVLGVIWGAPLIVCVLGICFWPGWAGKNRYGPSPRAARRSVLSAT